MRSAIVSVAVWVPLVVGCAEPKASDLAPPEKPEAPQPSPSGNVGLESALTVLIGADYSSYYEPGKADAVIALGVFKVKEAVPEIIRHAKASRNQSFRTDAHRALGWIGDAGAVEYLKTAMKNDPYIHARRTAALALEDITGDKYLTPEHGFKRRTPSKAIMKKLKELMKADQDGEAKPCDE
jgi:hypothetical protein